MRHVWQLKKRHRLILTEHSTYSARPNRGPSNPPRSETELVPVTVYKYLNPARISPARQCTVPVSGLKERAQPECKPARTGTARPFGRL